MASAGGIGDPQSYARPQGDAGAIDYRSIHVPDVYQLIKRLILENGDQLTQDIISRCMNTVIRNTRLNKHGEVLNEEPDMIENIQQCASTSPLPEPSHFIDIQSIKCNVDNDDNCYWEIQKLAPLLFHLFYSLLSKTIRSPEIDIHSLVIYYFNNEKIQELLQSQNVMDQINRQIFGLLHIYDLLKRLIHENTQPEFTTDDIQRYINIVIEETPIGTIHDDSPSVIDKMSRKKIEYVNLKLRPGPLPKENFSDIQKRTDTTDNSYWNIDKLPPLLVHLIYSRLPPHLKSQEVNDVLHIKTIIMSQLNDEKIQKLLTKSWVIDKIIFELSELVEHTIGRSRTTDIIGNTETRGIVKALKIIPGEDETDHSMRWARKQAAEAKLRREQAAAEAKLRREQAAAEAKLKQGGRRTKKSKKRSTRSCRRRSSKKKSRKMKTRRK
jgi:hypothetical protein